jgi:hypothetical protein
MSNIFPKIFSWDSISFKLDIACFNLTIISYIAHTYQNNIRFQKHFQAVIIDKKGRLELSGELISLSLGRVLFAIVGKSHKNGISGIGRDMVDTAHCSVAHGLSQQHRMVLGVIERQIELFENERHRVVVLDVVRRVYFEFTIEVVEELKFEARRRSCTHQDELVMLKGGAALVQVDAHHVCLRRAVEAVARAVEREQVRKYILR